MNKSYCLDFQAANCKNCYKCLRECPVKAIAVTNHQAKIIDSRCILCGTCTHVCPRNAKYVHSELDAVKELIKSGRRVIASVAPSFVSSFGIKDFSVMKIALGKLGFSDAEETAAGAAAVVSEYKKLLEKKTYKNFITSACPAVNRLIQLYYPEALPFLAKVDSPMIAHAKMLRKADNDAAIVFIGPCIAKKREAKESGLLDGVLTFEELKLWLDEKGVVFSDIVRLGLDNPRFPINKAKYFPISRGIIKSFDHLPDGYEYVAVDGVKRCAEILSEVGSLSGMFLELNACDYACVNGPCSLPGSGGAIKANADIRSYVNKDMMRRLVDKKIEPNKVSLEAHYDRIKGASRPVTDREIAAILAETGKINPEDELNCGACGYATCREKAWAVANGYAEVEMCLPYMRERAESMSYEIIQNSPNGIIAVDFDLKIIEISKKAIKLLGVKESSVKGLNLVDYMNPTDFLLAVTDGKKVMREKRHLERTGAYVELSITVLKEHKVMFGILKDITEEVDYDKRLQQMRLDTIKTTDEVIKKQMRVAQEIASLLGETTAETKVALLTLKKAISETENQDKDI